MLFWMLDNRNWEHTVYMPGICMKIEIYKLIITACYAPGNSGNQRTRDAFQVQGQFTRKKNSAYDTNA